jgi:hypothetical protein
MAVIEHQAIYTVENPSGKDWSGVHDRQRYTVPSGGAAPIPGAAIIGWFGDPELEGQARKETVERLRAKSGAFWDNVKWETLRPQLHVRDLDGNVIPTLITDVEVEAVMESPRLVDDRIERLERELASLKRASGSTLTQAAETAERPIKEISLDDLEEDTPGNSSK